jgi:two-component system nitrogen regulation sensor histidine kinase NtrY
MRRWRLFGHEGRVFLLALLGPLPAVLLALGLLATGVVPPNLSVAVGGVAVACWIAGALGVQRRVRRGFQTIVTLLGALRDGDFAIRARRPEPRDALGEALAELNQLSQALEAQRTGAVEASALLAKVMAEIDVAIFAFDDQRTLRLVNRTGERLLGRPPERLLAAAADEMGMADLLEGPAPRTFAARFPGGTGQWELRRGTFRLGGRPHTLVVLTNVQRALREEERQAWQRLVRVLGHELNNSLAPIRSMAGELQRILTSPDADKLPEWREDLGRGLAIIERRSEALGRFMTSYARLARLPPPRFGTVDVRGWIERVVALENRLPVRVVPGPDTTIRGDGDQLDQLLINLVKNGVDAALENGGGVEVSWQRLPGHLEVVVTDEGPGISSTPNLFVPFFTTKPNGSGIGLVLSRQIAEAHQGTLTLESRRDRPGAEARLRLPI